ncbi:MAG: OTU domain-containing protein, partial [Bacteroidota bacterium]
KAKHIDNDGNCLFRAVADQIECQLKIPFGRGAAPYMVLRRIAANHIISNVRLYKPFTEAQTLAGVEKLISEIEQDKAWAGDEALAILSRALQVTIVVVKDDAQDVPVYKPVHSQGTIYLYYKNRSHYESLYRDPALTVSNSLEKLLKSAATDSAFKPLGKVDLPAFLGNTANAIDREWKASSSQLEVAPTAADKKAALLKAAQEKNRLKKLQVAIATSYNKLPDGAANAKALDALLKQLEELLQLERLYGADKESAQTYLEKLMQRYGVGNTPLATLLEKAYSQELDRVASEDLLKENTDTTPQLVTVLNKLAQLHQAQGAHTGNVKYYTDAALLYQTILRACTKDDKRDYNKEREVVYANLTKARAGLLAGCKAKGVPLKTVQAEIQQDRAELEKLRAYAKQRVEALDAIIHKEGMSKEEERKADEIFIKGSEKLFGEITEGMKKFIARLYRECEQDLA